MSTSTSAPLLASAVDATPIPPSCARASVAVHSMSKPRTQKPRATRFLAMGKPIAPRPIKPTVIKLASMRQPRLDLAHHGVRRDAIALVQGRKRSGIEELVRQPDLPERRRHAGAQQQ